MFRRLAILVPLSLFGLSACALNPFGGDPVKDARDITPIGSAFNQALYRAYLTRADEKLELDNKAAAKVFAERARDAGNGNAVLPADLIADDIGEAAFADLDKARTTLVQHLVEGGRDQAAEESAQSQSYFDCWVHAAETGDETETARCRSAFETALSSLQVALNAAPSASEAMPEPMTGEAIRRDYKVYFGFDEWHLSAEALEVITESIETARNEGQSEIVSAGHTDTAGPAYYNKTLSERRAVVVKEVMVEMGARAEAVRVVAMGEEQPAVATGDGVKEARNRRVEISLVP